MVLNDYIVCFFKLQSRPKGKGQLCTLCIICHSFKSLNLTLDLDSSANFLLFTVNSIEKTKITKKRPGITHFIKYSSMDWNSAGLQTELFISNFWHLKIRDLR